MKLLSVEPTPSPNTMKLNVDERWPAGRRAAYTPERAEEAPEPLRSLLKIDGVKGVFRTADFIALDRKPGADWQRILAEAAKLFETAEGADPNAAPAPAGPDAAFGELHVLVQVYRGIPMQVRVRSGDREVARLGLPEKFSRAVHEAAGSTLIMERRLEEYGIRYGEPEEIAAQVAAELDAAYPDERLRELVEAAKAMGPAAPDVPVAPRERRPLSAEELARALEAPDWQTRYAALERTQPEPSMLPLLAKALRDDHVSIRRLAVVYLGDLRSPEALPLLIEALGDRSPAVRRTAGDTLNDLGDPAAMPAMIGALKDPNKLVRWRAARFLYELGDESALPALREAAEDEEFEVRLQARMALERIERGEEAAGTVWQQMPAARRERRDTQQ
ncbi:MAG: virulence factor [Thermobacillus sp. ZCTH02-B1]|uniref:conserved virulence factor C family protein n=1 Tax=Thermobacillus sp. ZCTH02-B1 TaxID=1858795 RepID=UPI000B56783F|nr:conserved virulence factor C family protein [Thermobacillus sp. ZCTH02-B1]OUM95702.1 MAG: virulence factor [Thermobacillus sp. ZCTH02-B1]